MIGSVISEGFVRLIDLLPRNQLKIDLMSQLLFITVKSYLKKEMFDLMTTISIEVMSWASTTSMPSLRFVDPRGSPVIKGTSVMTDGPTDRHVQSNISPLFFQWGYNNDKIISVRHTCWKPQCPSHSHRPARPVDWVHGGCPALSAPSGWLT